VLKIFSNLFVCLRLKPQCGSARENAKEEKFFCLWGITACVLRQPAVYFGLFEGNTELESPHIINVS
jgi:hypothetical protein